MWQLVKPTSTHSTIHCGVIFPCQMSAYLQRTALLALKEGEICLWLDVLPLNLSACINFPRQCNISALDRPGKAGVSRTRSPRGVQTCDSACQCVVESLKMTSLCPSAVLSGQKVEGMRQEGGKNSYRSETESFDDTDKWMLGVCMDPWQREEEGKVWQKGWTSQTALLIDLEVKLSSMDGICDIMFIMSFRKKSQRLQCKFLDDLTAEM